MVRLSKNFTLQEFTKSQTAERRGFDNTPVEGHLENAKIFIEPGDRGVKVTYKYYYGNYNYRQSIRRIY